MLAIDADLFKVFAFWGSIVAFKVMAMLLFIARYRFGQKIFLNPDDAFLKRGTVAFNDPDIERVRRAHLNDLENIPIWYVVTAFWLTTGPSAWLAGILIKTFVYARIVHTLTYAVCPMQPHRAIGIFVAYSVMGYQAISTRVIPGDAVGLESWSSCYIQTLNLCICKNVLRFRTINSQEINCFDQLSSPTASPGITLCCITFNSQEYNFAFCMGFVI